MGNDEKMMERIMEILIKMNAAADAAREHRKADKEELMAKMDADRKADKEDLMAKMESNQKKAEEDRKDDKGRMDADRRAFIEWMKAKTKATQAETKAIIAKTKATQAETKAILAATKARREKRMEANTNDDRNESTACKDVMEASTEKMEHNLEENEDVVERQRVHDEETAIHSQKDKQNEMNAYNEATETIEQDPGIM
jgi:hypothetical protein